MEEVPPTPLNPGQIPSELPEPLRTPTDSRPYPGEPAPQHTPQPLRTPQQAPPQSARIPLYAPNRQPLSVPNYEDPNDVNTLPDPMNPNAIRTYPVAPEAAPTLETDFDKRNERLREEATPLEDEAMAAGMVALGDVLKKRPQPQQLVNTQASSQPMVPPSQMPYPQPLAMPAPPISGRAGQAMPLYRQAIAVGIIAALIIAPVVIFLLVHH